MTESTSQPRGDSGDGATSRSDDLHAEIQRLGEFIREFNQKSAARYEEWRAQPLDSLFGDSDRPSRLDEFKQQMKEDQARWEEYDRRRKEHDARWEEMQRDIERRLDALERRRREESGREPQTGAPEGC